MYLEAGIDLGGEQARAPASVIRMGDDGEDAQIMGGHGGASSDVLEARFGDGGGNPSGNCGGGVGECRCRARTRAAPVVETLSRWGRQSCLAVC